MAFGPCTAAVAALCIHFDRSRQQLNFLEASALNFIKTSIMEGDKQPEQCSTLLDSLEQERLRCIRRNQAMLEQCQAGAALPIGPDNPSP